MDTSQGYINQPYLSEWLCVTVMKLDTAWCSFPVTVPTCLTVHGLDDMIEKWVIIKLVRQYQLTHCG